MEQENAKLKMKMLELKQQLAAKDSALKDVWNKLETASVELERERKLVEELREGASKKGSKQDVAILQQVISAKDEEIAVLHNDIHSKHEELQNQEEAFEKISKDLKPKISGLMERLKEKDETISNMEQVANRLEEQLIQKTTLASDLGKRNEELLVQMSTVDQAISRLQAETQAVVASQREGAEVQRMELQREIDQRVYANNELQRQLSMPQLE
ncbi:hypothetical protein CYMTET_36751 [Cymbomonas tetramitiformis]|uniref:Uncharacterized protein n=1 Tax=Cymbomonas tetramitiformis TaxID=36881 RepID=A0AAE0F7S3_9CHLO|nr:hypothetical protein CYMTET_36751 [Cymbomonas tetramitiformis]|eukprot:gene25345-30938_t